jgi:hypothetical protein
MITLCPGRENLGKEVMYGFRFGVVVGVGVAVGVHTGVVDGSGVDSPGGAGGLVPGIGVGIWGVAAHVRSAPETAR